MLGVFDSGLGGLTALCELRRLRPDLDILYFGDTARVPYGTRSRETIIRYAREALGFLVSRGTDAILVACGTVSSVALPYLAPAFPVPLIGVVEPAALLAYHASKNRSIGIIATEATVESRAFETALHRLGRVTTCSLACPLFVSLAENGFTSPGDPVAREAVRHYLPPLRKTGIDTLILGCTHFPLLAPQISAALPGVRLIGAGEAAAAAMVAANPKVGHGELEVYISDAPARFEKEAERLLGAPLPTKVQKYAL